MPTIPIWVLEDDPRRAEQMLRRCAQWNVAVCVFRTAAAMIAEFDRASILPGVISLDHDLNCSVPADDPACGMDAVDWLVRHAPFAEVIVHSSNAPAAAMMVARLIEADWPVDRSVPANDLEWIDNDWIARIAAALRRAVAGSDAGLLLAWDDELRASALGDAVLLGVLTDASEVRLYGCSPVNDPLRSRFRCHADLIRYSSIDRTEIAGGFSLIVRLGRLAGFSRQSSLNDPAGRYLLPIERCHAIIEEVELPRAERFRLFP